MPYMAEVTISYAQVYPEALCTNEVHAVHLSNVKQCLRLPANCSQ